MQRQIRNKKYFQRKIRLEALRIFKSVNELGASSPSFLSISQSTAENIEVTEREDMRVIDYHSECNENTVCLTDSAANLVPNHSSASDIWESNEDSDNDRPHISDDLVDRSILGATSNKTSTSISTTNLLKQWAISHRITHVAVKDLLQILSQSSDPEFQVLPKDPRTFLSTPRQYKIRNVNPGHYSHIGIGHSVELYYQRLNEKPSSPVEIAINIDGLPLSKSSSSQLYPILGIIQHLKHQHVFLIGVYHGYEKPRDFNDFLIEFVEEAKYLTKFGLQIFGESYEFKINMFLFDAVAKSSILYIKGHSGYSSCTKCSQRGEYLNDRICFPELHYEMRTHDSFMEQVDQDHHLGRTLLSEIPNIDLIQDVPLDYMHLICLGVVKKFLVSTWCFGRPPHKFSIAQIDVVSEQLLLFVKYIPSEFVRHPRSLKESKRWKATEFRQFIFYTGPLALKFTLGKQKYEHFLTLHVAISILTSVQLHSEYLDYADSLLIHFIQVTKIIYGSHFLSHNLHNLLHLSDDVRKFGNLDNFSNFSSENFLQYIKTLIRKPVNVLPQIICRITEINNVFVNSECNHCIPFRFRFIQEHSTGILTKNCTNPQYKTVIFPHFKISCNNANSCCMLKDKSIVEVKNIAFCPTINEYVLIGYNFKHTSDFYTYPCKSSLLGIYFVKTIGTLSYWPVEQIDKKLFRLPYLDGFVVYPLLHFEKK